MSDNEKQTKPLFAFLRTVAIAAGRGKLTAREAAVATWVALDSRGTSGENAYLDPSRVGKELGISPRTAQRIFYDLLGRGWFERTAEARRGKPGEPGSGLRARYRLQLPALDLGLGATKSSEVLSGQTELVAAQVESESLSHQAVASDPWHDRPTTHGTTDQDPWCADGQRDAGVGTPLSTPNIRTPLVHPSASPQDRARELGEMDDVNVQVADQVHGSKAVNG